MTAVLDPGRPFTGNERELLESTLDLHRAELLATVCGLSDTQARQHLVPSLTTPISLGQALRRGRTYLVSAHTRSHGRR